jgi:hypothetical protein
MRTEGDKFKTKLLFQEFYLLCGEAGDSIIINMHTVYRIVLAYSTGINL